MATRDARLAELFEQIISSPPDQRAKLIAASRKTDPSLAHDLESLLSAHDVTNIYFDEFSRDVLSPAMSAVGLDDGKADSNLLERLKEAIGADYSIEQEIAGGGMSRVFIATEIRLGRKVVIKTLPQVMPLAVSVERFRREIQVAAGLQNSHIVPVLTTGAVDGFLYYVMPYIDGETLRARLSRVGPLPVDEALSIWRDVLDALGAAHHAGIVHRDIKPENILLSGRNALVADFGIARAVKASTEGIDASSPGVTVGTPAYMAPEQMLEESSGDNRIDIYAAGLVMYEMLSGRSPFSGMSLGETIRAQQSHAPPALSRHDVPQPIASLVRQCVEKDPSLRPASVESILEELDRAKTRDPRDRSRRIVVTAGVGLAAVALAGVLVFALLLKSDVTARNATASQAQPSLLVLPLTNLSRDSGDVSLSDGMTAELVGALSRNSNLRVISGASLLSNGRAHGNPREIARRLGVASILEGSMEKIGSRLHMQVRLTDARDGSTRWSEAYDRDMKNVFSVQDEISKRVSSELDARSRSARQALTPERYTPNLIAYEWYLRGMDVSLMRTNAGTRQGIQYFENAIRADPRFAAAYAGLTRLYLQIGNGDPNRQEWFARAESAAVKAVALDDSLAEGHAGLGWVLSATGRMARAEKELKTAVALNPNAPRVHEGLARLYLETGRPLEELAEARAGLASDPLSYSAIREMALALNMNKRCDESLNILAPLKELSPPAGVAGVIAGQCYAYKKMWPEAIAEFRWSARRSARIAPAFLAYALARGGHEKEARKILSDMLANRTFSRGAFGIGIVYAGLRDYDRAFEWLEKGIADGQSAQYILDPMFEDLHRDPRFGRLNLFSALQKR
jgi:eukaryotic-like serine/threonine-protein kinase